ncbi:MAG: SurA N-terminal domain-containing protein [Deltaproteobacteria bacterium]|nr:SurA N-terminal domain-containing protein [Deltaproteobacteria bacterium]
MKLKRRIAVYLLLAAALAGALVAGAAAYRRHYLRHLWDPEVAALVNGRPVPRSALEAVLEMGDYPSLALGGPRAGAVTVSQILDRLVDEELVLQAAEANLVRPSEGQVEESLAAFMVSWGCRADGSGSACRAPGGQAKESFVEAVRKRLLLNEMVRRAAAWRSRPNSREWRRFWREFLIRRLPGALFLRTRALLTQDEPQVEAILSRPGRRSLDELAEQIRQAGFQAVVSRPLALQPLALRLSAAPAADDATGRLRPELLAELAEALRRPGRLTAPVNFGDSLAVFEVLEVARTTEPEELAEAARAAYEREIGERAFEQWLAELRASAEITVNPNLLESDRLDARPEAEGVEPTAGPGVEPIVESTVGPIIEPIAESIFEPAATGNGTPAEPDGEAGAVPTGSGELGGGPENGPAVEPEREPQA